jgi:DNA-binding MarR family transcriptional regulator
VAHLQGSVGIGGGTLAQALHVSSAFIASETGKLAQRGLLIKRTNPADRRGVLLSVAPAGRLKLDRTGAEIRTVNDLFFGALDAQAFAALSKAAAGLVAGSAKAARHIASAREAPQAGLRKTG